MGGMRRGGGGTCFARPCALLLALFLLFGWPTQGAAYAVLAHEAIVDSVWDTNIRPLLGSAQESDKGRILSGFPKCA